MPHDPHLADRMRHALVGRPGISEKRMFGGFCWMLNGHMLCGVEVGRFMFRVGIDRTDEALARAGATPMDITVRVMRGLVWVDEKAAAGEALADWIDFAAEFVEALPPK